MPKKRVVVAVTGATGIVYAVTLLKKLRTLPEVETHLVVSPTALLTLKHEMNQSRAYLNDLADVIHHYQDVGASISSGSFKTAGMLIVPCSMKTLASVAHGFSDNLIARAADVHLKEKRPLVLAVRETPFNLAHLRNMTAVAEMGGIIYPPLPAFYHHPETIEDMVEHNVERMLGYLGLDVDTQEWQGLSA
ncbi:UbiX family flavin prenyltransferase [Basilea psittacipulmonis]|uniref:Flavin prenyltransferase UbiX n=1 Tax=Basilea psittacipulmonis DSM 24701 TaxID=1072685 RepID=A0A077DBN0_9BURK|nr:UbiX family flavin prenyltransferase [Basilea psittacipulmonis]AIL32074.1 3-octaprenyl-4-hydroxybenzoate carboxy-lyase [Basilea psittacipulmonis DSM 24701]